MTTTKHRLFSALLSVFLIISLIAPSVSLAMEDGASSDSSSSDSDSSDSSSSDSSSDSDSDAASGGSGREDSQNAGSGSGSQAGDAAAADAAAQGAADSVSEAASISGVDVSVDKVDPKADPTGKAGGSVSVNGQTMSVDAAISAIGAIADAKAQGLNPSYSSNQPGVDVDATLSAHAMGDVGVVGKMSSEFGTASEVAKAESEHAGRQAAVGYANSFDVGRFGNTAAPTTDVNAALSVAMTNYAQAKQAQVAPPTQSALMSATSLSQQTAQLSTNLSNVNTSHAPVGGVTATQSFSTTNKSIDATSFSLGSFTTGQSSSPTASTPNSSMSVSDQYSQAAFGTALGRLSSIKSNTQSQITAITKGVGYLTDTQLAQVAAMETQIAAIDARTTAMVSPTITNQAVAALAEQKAVEIASIAETVATQEELGQATMASNNVMSIQSRIDAFDSRISAAKADTTVAQTEVTNNSKLAAYDVEVALGNVPAPTSNMTAPASSAIADIGISLGLNPTTANAIAANVNSFMNAVVGVVPGLATVSAVTNYTETKALSKEVAVQAQEVVSALTAAGVANPYSFLSQDEKNQLSSANTLSSQAKALGSQAIGIAMMDIMGISTIGMANSLGKSAAQSVVSGRTTTASPVSKSITPTDVVSNATPNNVSISYNTSTNTFTVSTPPSVAGRVAQGRFSTTGQANTSSVGYRSVTTENPASQAVTANKSAATSPSTAANTTATGRSTPVGRNSATTENPASQAVAAADNVPATPNTVTNTPAAGRTAVSAENPASKAVAASDNPATPRSLADNVSTPASAVDNSAVPGVTRSNDSFLGRTFTSRENPASRNITATVMALAELTSAALSPTSITSKSIAGVADRVASAITRSADDIATTPTQSTVSVTTRSTTNVTPTNQVSVTPASATKAPVATTPAVGLATLSGVPSASIPSSQTPTAQTETPTTQAVATQAEATPPATTETPTTATQGALAEAGIFADNEASPATPTETPSTPAATTPSSQAPTPPADIPSSPTNAQPAAPNQTAPTSPSRDSVADTLSKIADGVGSALGELLGVKPAASKPTQTVNFANLENTPATRDFVGVVPDSSGRFLEFSDNTTAGRALLRDLDNKISDLSDAGTTPTLNTIIPKYSPASDSNNPTQHANNIARVVANDVPDFTANTPITVTDLQGPVGVGLIKGFAQAEEGINLPTAEAAKGVAAYTAIPSVPTTLKNGVYAPTNPANQAQLDAIRSNPSVATAEVSPQQATPAPQIVQDLTQIVRGAAELSPTVIAVRAAASFFDRALTPEAKQTTPAVQAPTNAVATPAVLTSTPTTAVSPGTPGTNVRQGLITSQVDANGVAIDTKGVDPRLVDIIAETAKDFPLRVELFSGKVGRSKGTHSRGLAVDIMIYDTAGNPLAAYMVSETANIYALFAERARKVQMKLYPELNNSFVWGGAFTGMVKSPGGTAKYGGGDFMDFRIGGAINTNQMQAYKFGEGWQEGFEYYTAGDVLGIGPRAITEADYAQLEGFQLSPAQVASQIEKSTKGAKQGGRSTPTQFHAGLLGHRSIGPQQTISVEVVPVEVTPVEVVPVEVVPVLASPSTQPSTAAPSTVAQPNAPTLSSSQTNQPSVPAVTTASIPSQSNPTSNTPLPGGNSGTPPNNLGVTGPGIGSAPSSISAIEKTSLAVYSTVAAVVAFVASVMGDDEESENEEENQTADNTTTPPTQTSETPVGPTSGAENTVTSVPPNQIQSTNVNQNNYVINDDRDSFSTSSKPTTNVLIQVDGNTGDMYFSVEGVYTDNAYKNYNYIHEEDDPNEIETETENPSIILDDQRQNVIYSDGTYAPVVVDGVWYESVEDSNYVYTVEYYQDGELVETAENAGVLPQGNPLSNLLNSLFSDTSSYQLADIDAVTRALIDPDSEVPADEYYIYRVYLKNGDVRGTTVPKYTSYRYMNERFAETGFVGNVLTLIAESVEIPPPSSGPVMSKIVETLKDVGLSALDLFRNNEGDDNPIVTDFGTLTPSDDDEITMNDIQSVLVLLDVEAECPFVPGLTRPYLYEIVIAQNAIRGATSDQAFRAVRCGGGEKQDFVDQIADHFETFDDVGTLDRQRLSEMIRFSAFQDLDMSSLVAEATVETETVSTSTTTVPENTTTETETFKPNVSNEITFEVKAIDTQGQTVLDWTNNSSINISSGSQLYFRWDGSSYQQCLPFLNDNGNYSLTVKNRAMTTGNTESEGYNITERSAVYRIECGGQRNNEFGVDDRSIEITVE